jgi:ABC-2 type transport system permease protein
MFSAISIVWDREFGFLKEVLVAPVPRWSVAIGKILGGATVAMTQSLIMVALAPLVGVSLSIPIILELLLLAFLISFAVTGLGVSIAARMQSMQGFQMIMNFLVMPLYFLSGAMFPMATAPTWMKTLMTVDPLTYGVDALRNVVFAGTMIRTEMGEQPLVEVARYAGLIRWDLSFDLMIITLVAAVLASAAAFRFSAAE